MTEQALSTGDIEAAERLLGIVYSAREREQMLGNLDGQIAWARLRRAAPLENAVPMASRFDPRLPSFRMPAAAGAMRFSVVEDVPGPADEEVRELRDLAHGALRYDFGGGPLGVG